MTTHNLIEVGLWLAAGLLVFLFLRRRRARKAR